MNKLTHSRLRTLLPFKQRSFQSEFENICYCFAKKGICSLLIEFCFKYSSIDRNCILKLIIEIVHIYNHHQINIPHDCNLAKL